MTLFRSHLLTLLASTSAIWSAVMSASLASAADDNLTLQVRADVRSAIDHTRSAKNHLELDASGFSARDVFANIHALRKKDAWQSLCSALNELSGSDLALYDGPIQNPSFEKDLPCAISLRARLDEYWSRSRAKLEEHFTHHSLVSARQRSVAALPKPQPASFSGEIPVRAQEVRRIDGSLSDGILQERQIVLTFNDGPSPMRTPRILAILKSAGAHAMFFDLGENIRAHSDLTRRVAAEGHIVATHSMTHLALPRLALASAFKEIDQGRQEVETSTGRDTPFIRMPYGATDDELNDFLHERKMTAFYSNMDSHDWQITDSTLLFDRILKEIDRERGGILAMRETSETTVIVLPFLLQELKARGFTTLVFAPR